MASTSRSPPSAARGCSRRWRRAAVPSSCQPTVIELSITAGGAMTCGSVARTAVAVIAGGSALLRGGADDRIGLTGNNRAGFVDSAVAACQNAQLAAPENKDTQFKDIVDYCRCYANSMADRMSVNDVKSAAEYEAPANLPERFQVTINAASDYCIDKMSQ